MIYLLGSTKHKDTTNLELIQISYKKINPTCKDYEALVCTSKQALYALENSSFEWKHIPLYVIGQGTKSVALELGANVQNVSKEAYGDAFANEIAGELAGKRVLFVRAKEVVSKVSDILRKSDVLVEDIVGYETTCRCAKIQVLAKKSVIIFTSPSTVKCFFESYEWDDSFKAVCIGKKTLEHLPDGVEAFVSSTQTINGCVNLAKRVILVGLCSAC